MTLDKILHFLAKAAVRLHCLPKGDIRHMYVWKASAVAYARVRGEPLTIKMVDEWCFWEQRYANAGYWPFTLDRLEQSARDHETLHPPEHHQLRLPGERATLHAKRFRQNLLEGASP